MNGAEILSGFVIAVAAVGGALVVLPRAKPAPPPMPVVLELRPKAVQRAEPLPEKSDAERVAELQKQLSEIAAEQRRLTDDVKAITKRDPPSLKLRRTRKEK